MQTLVLTSSVNHGVGQGNEKLGNGQEKEKPLPHKAPTEIVVEMLALPYARQSAVSETGKKTVVESDQKHTSLTAQIWDKGVNVKEYIVNKIEPGKALSQVITNATSPRKPRERAVVEKVKEVVSYLL
ncbi:hypothetical protein ACOSQ3_025370 [Xanthoceras sorbifolium]